MRQQHTDQRVVPRPDQVASLTLLPQLTCSDSRSSDQWSCICAASDEVTDHSERFFGSRCTRLFAAKGEAPLDALIAWRDAGGTRAQRWLNGTLAPICHEAGAAAQRDAHHGEPAIPELALLAAVAPLPCRAFGNVSRAVFISDAADAHPPAPLQESRVAFILRLVGAEVRFATTVARRDVRAQVDASAGAQLVQSAAHAEFDLSHQITRILLDHV